MSDLTPQMKAKLKYQQRAVKKITIDFHLTNDADILERLNEVPAKASYIKKLIREDIAKNKKIGS